MNRQQRRNTARLERSNRGRLITGALEIAIDRVMDGTLSPTEAVERAPYEVKGALPLTLARLGAPPEMVRDALDAAWPTAHHLMRESLDRDELIALFTVADFEIPDTLPDTLTVWRGTSSLSLDKARAGLSWTLDRSVACHFATDHWQRHGTRGIPLVLKRTIRRSDIVYFSDRLKQAEVVIRAEPAGEVDGDPADWRAASKALLERKAADA